MKFLKSIYFPEDEFLQAKKKGGASWIWSSILKGRELLLKGGKWVGGDGDFKSLVPAQRLDLLVSSLIDPVNKQWDLGRVRATVPLAMAIKAIQIPISYMETED